MQQRYSLYDKFHETNTKQQKEILRRTEFLKELDGVDTETAEQLNSFLSKKIYFLDIFSPIHHVQMIRSMLTMRNQIKNACTLPKLKGLRGYGDLAEDEYGRVMIAKNMDLNENTDVPINKLVKPLLNSDVTITETIFCFFDRCKKILCFQTES